MKRSILVVTSFLLLAGLIACSDGDPMGSATGNVAVFLTDAPIDLDEVTAVNVTIEEMVLFPICEEPDADCAGIPLDLVPPEGVDGVTVNLLEYRDGHVILMASAQVPEGDYGKIRMEIATATLFEDTDQDPTTPGTEEEIFLPSGKVDVVVPFGVTAGEDTQVILDFDAALSVHVNQTGNHKYILRPVINGSLR
jgi:hypothetical protein